VDRRNERHGAGVARCRERKPRASQPGPDETGKQHCPENLFRSPLIAALLREGIRQTFRHPLAPRAPVTPKRRRSQWIDKKGGGRCGGGQPYVSRWQAVKPVATKHGRVAKSSSPYIANSGWPEDMKMERYAAQRLGAAAVRAWEIKWAAVLSGEAARRERQARSTATRPARRLWKPPRLG
jgi:hypothetical protein